MPRRSILSGPERDSLLAIPESTQELIRLYTFSESDLALIRQRGKPVGLRNPSGTLQTLRTGLVHEARYCRAV